MLTFLFLSCSKVEISRIPSSVNRDCRSLFRDFYNSQQSIIVKNFDEISENWQSIVKPIINRLEDQGIEYRIVEHEEMGVGVEIVGSRKHPVNRYVDRSQEYFNGVRVFHFHNFHVREKAYGVHFTYENIISLDNNVITNLTQKEFFQTLSHEMRHAYRTNELLKKEISPYNIDFYPKGNIDRLNKLAYSDYYSLQELETHRRDASVLLRLIIKNIEEGYLSKARTLIYKYKFKSELISVLSEVSKDMISDLKKIDNYNDFLHTEKFLSKDISILKARNDKHNTKYTVYLPWLDAKKVKAGRITNIDKSLIRDSLETTLNFIRKDTAHVFMDQIISKVFSQVNNRENQLLYIKIIKNSTQLFEKVPKESQLSKVFKLRKRTLQKIKILSGEEEIDNFKALEIFKNIILKADFENYPLKNINSNEYVLKIPEMKLKIHFDQTGKVVDLKKYLLF